MSKPSESTREQLAVAQKPARAPAVKPSPSGMAALLKRYGITTVPRPTYEWGGYRYTNPGDAIAAAKRGETA
ncbi:MAG TPA: hypothetical protein VJ775_05360 [Sphingomicrobium sp.]|nr:hypothetical protein [Sphingomicrobium sp.]